MPVDGSEFGVECDSVIAAVGQVVDRTPAEKEGLRVTGWGLWTDDKTHANSLPGVFAGGGAVLGADLAVRAVATGRCEEPGSRVGPRLRPRWDGRSRS